MGSRRASLTGFIVVLAAAAPASAATEVQTYDPIDDDGTLRAGLTVERGGTTAECWTESYAAYGAIRCSVGDFIRDPCFIDTRVEQNAVLCVRDPWSTVALGYDVEGDLPDPTGPKVTPWALELKSGARCTFAQGAGQAVGSFRMNYICSKSKKRRSPVPLYGSPNRSRPTWTIRGARSFKSQSLYRVAISTAWR